MKEVSFIIPCYQSQNTLMGVVYEIEETMYAFREIYSYEIILVNDCSPDGTFDIIKKICNERRYVKGLSFAKNFGQHAALMAGLREAKGDYVVCMDDDGQTPANEVGKLLEALENGADAVYASYVDKKHSMFRNWGSKLNDLMACVMLKKPIELRVSSYFAVKRFVVNEMIRYEHSYPYVIGLVLRSTKNITNVNVNHRERKEGVSGYNIKKLVALWLNGFTAFSIIPLRIATIIGVFSASAGFIYGIYIIIKKIIGINVPMGYSTIMASIIFFGGMIMIMLGLVGEYVGRAYICLNSSPQYVISERVE